jgi:hypothetical protein
MAEDDKPRPVPITTPMYLKERTNDIKLNKDKARRLIARMLRDEGKMIPAKANDLATRICDGMISAMEMPVHPGLRNARVIPDHPPYGQASQLADLARSIRPDQSDHATAEAVWDMVYKYGYAVPDAVVA